MNYCKLNYYNYNKSYDKLKEIGVKNCTCYYFDDLVRVVYSGFSNI